MPNTEKKCKVCESYRGNPPPHVCSTFKARRAGSITKEILNKNPEIAIEVESDTEFQKERFKMNAELIAISPTDWDEKEREAFETWLSKTRAPIGEGFPPNSLQVADYWITRLATARIRAYKKGRLSEWERLGKPKEYCLECQCHGPYLFSKDWNVEKETKAFIDNLAFTIKPSNASMEFIRLIRKTLPNLIATARTEADKKGVVKGMALALGTAFNKKGVYLYQEGVEGIRADTRSATIQEIRKMVEEMRENSLKELEESLPKKGGTAGVGFHDYFSRSRQYINDHYNIFLSKLDNK